MKRGLRWGAALLLLGMMGVTGCNNEAATPGSIPASDTTEGAGGTAVGKTSTAGISQPQTGTSTQRMGTGYAGPITTPGPGQSGR